MLNQATDWHKPEGLGVLLKRRPDRATVPLCCPICKSVDVKKASLAYQEGAQDWKARSRLRGVATGSDGPDVFVGSVVSEGSQQTQLAKRLAPPAKWSYTKLVLWSGVVWVATLIVYIRSVMTAAAPVSAGPGWAYLVLSAGTVLGLLIWFTWHNFVVFPRRYMAWDRSFVCLRCGAVWE